MGYFADHLMSFTSLLEIVPEGFLVNRITFVKVSMKQQLCVYMFSTLPSFSVSRLVYANCSFDSISFVFSFAHLSLLGVYGRLMT